MDDIYSGRLKTNQKGYYVKRLSFDQLNEILRLQEIVYQQLENKDTLQRLSDAEFRYILDGNGFMIGAFVEGELIAIRALLVPPIDAEHLGLVIGLKEEELDRVIYQEISFVDPANRGNRLQQQLADLIMKELEKSEHDYHYICCTVAPANIPSLKDKFNQSMKIKALDKIYGDHLRYVFMKDLQTEQELEWKKVRRISMDQIELQQQLLDCGWVGIQLVEEHGGYWIVLVDVCE